MKNIKPQTWFSAGCLFGAAMMMFIAASAPPKYALVSQVPWTNNGTSIGLVSTNMPVTVEGGWLLLTTNGQKYFMVTTFDAFNENWGKPYSAIWGGQINVLDATHGSIVGGYDNQSTNDAIRSFIGGGETLRNYGGEYAGMIGGHDNENNGAPANFFAAGTRCTIRSNTGFVLMGNGEHNIVDMRAGSDYVTMIGGIDNLAENKATAKFFLNIWGGDRCKVTERETWVIGSLVTNNTQKCIEIGFYDTNKFRVRTNIAETVGGMPLASSGISSATNGFASNSTLVTNAVGGTGYTNNQTINQTAYLNGSAVAVTVKDRSGTTIVPATTFTGTLTVPLQPGWAVTAASGLTGTVTPF